MRKQSDVIAALKCCGEENLHACMTCPFEHGEEDCKNLEKLAVKRIGFQDTKIKILLREIEKLKASYEDMVGCCYTKEEHLSVCRALEKTKKRMREQEYTLTRTLENELSLKAQIKDLESQLEEYKKTGVTPSGIVMMRECAEDRVERVEELQNVVKHLRDDIVGKAKALHHYQCSEKRLKGELEAANKKFTKFGEHMEYHLENNEENGIVYIPKFVVETIIKLLRSLDK